MEHRYFPLTEPTLARRLHRTESQPPMLRSASGFYVSRSDNVMSAVPDLVLYRDDLFAFSSVWGGTSADKRCGLNTVIYSPYADESIYITRPVALLSPSSPPTLFHTVYSSGTVTNSSGSGNVSGSSTSWVRNVWPGCFLKFASESEWYRIESVNSDTSLTLEGTPDAHTGSSYQILQVHDHSRAKHPVHVERFSDVVLYNACSPENPENAETISGPFWAEIDPISGASSSVFTRLSDNYMSSAFAVCDGYVVLFGVREYNVATTSWTYYPNRMVWTAPGSYDDFSSTGSGYQDVDGATYFFDARSVAHCIVAFDTLGIVSFGMTGDIDAPFEYREITRSVQALSNPLVHNGVVYFIAADGLLYGTDGVSIRPVPTSFDMTEYADFGARGGAQLILDGLSGMFVAFYPVDSGTPYAITIDPHSGAVGEIELPVIPEYAGGPMYPQYAVQIVSSVGAKASVPSYPTI